MKIKALLILVLFTGLVLKSKAQNVVIQGDSIIVTNAIIFEGDTIPNVHLREIVIFPELIFKSKQEARRYTKLMRDLKRVYPYAQLAKNKLNELEREYINLQTEKERKAFTKTIEKQLMDEFGPELRKLTITQGRLLLKLIDRETGNTSYEILKELRGTFSAVFWQAIARIFGSDLKSEYDADGMDYLIERIVILIEHGQL
ncbi:MAG: hypothetical protein A2W99_17615 [Bacteroidetes bacterium GWF2_33_16]|nr:MAG: hypothetical protein A2X00_14755 [Bacteroidetes bacterium GWE2_32_14]OFY06855.1 MAG: hypothetical protein A2W99_17615 [Bacteroidetes bacterium GWF2_33_16]